MFEDSAELEIQRQNLASGMQIRMRCKTRSNAMRLAWFISRTGQALGHWSLFIGHSTNAPKKSPAIKRPRGSMKTQ
jgi:hypothetical protein